MYMACAGMHIYLIISMNSFTGNKLSPAVHLLLGLGQPGDIQSEHSVFKVSKSRRKSKPLGEIDNLNRIGYEYHIHI